MMDDEDFMKKLLEAKQTTKLQVQPEQEETQNSIVSHRFMLTIDVYPNGKVYPKVFPIGQTKKDFSQKKKKTGVKAQTVLVDEEEIY